MPPNFYNAGDQAIYAAGDFFIPQERYRAAPYTVNQPTNPDEVPAGIPTVYRPQGSGAFNPYNTDMSNVRQDYNAFPSRQAGEIYSGTFNPQPYGTGVESAQAAYNQANQALAQGIDPNSQGYNSFTGGTLTGLKDVANEIIMNNKEQYGAQGQYIDPYDPNYSSMTEAQKFMDNYPDYYGVPSGVPETGIPGAIKSYMQNSLLGKGLSGVGSFIESILPIDQRTIAENEARGAGIFTDDIGRIVTDDYNTAGGIMAGYNLNALTKEGSTALTDRKNTVMNTLENKYGLNKSTVDALRKDPNYTGPAKTLIDRLDLFDEFEDEIKGITSRKKQIYKMKLDKRAADKKRKEAEKAAKEAAQKAAEEAAQRAEVQRMQAENRDRGRGGYQSSWGGGGGAGGDGGGFMGGSGTAADMGSFARGGRVYYMDGGLADLVDIYD